MVLQCPVFEDERAAMFSEIRRLPNNLGANALDNDADILGTLLGRSIDGYTIEQMEMVWSVSGRYIDTMYRRNLRVKKGEG